MQAETLIRQLTLPVVAAPLFLISCPKMVVECCKNGIVGTFPALNQRSSQGFEQWLVEIKQELDRFSADTGKQAAPFGVNLIVHGSNPRLEADLEICLKHRVPLVITSLGAVPELVNEVHAYGGLVFHDVIKRRHAEKAAAAGVDGLILVAAGAGGHAGSINPMPLLAEVKRFFHKTVLLSGCISNGRDIASALQMGADLAYIGTRFINIRESNASPEYQQMIIEAGASDIIYTAAISGINANFLRPSLEAMGITQAQWDKPGKLDFAGELNEAKAWETIWSAGQGVSAIDDILPIAELVARLKNELRAALEAQINTAKRYL